MRNETGRIALVGIAGRSGALIRRRFGNRGWLVRSWKTGAQFLEDLGEQSYDFVVTEIVLPDMDGLELIDWVRRNRPNMHILVLTRASSTSAMNLALEKGVRFYMESSVPVHVVEEAVLSLDGDGASGRP